MNIRRDFICCIAIIGLFAMSLIAAPAHHNLPVLEFPVENGPNYFVILFSGDGGWKTIDQSMTNNLNAGKISVVALNMMKYLWTEKSPLQIAKDLEKLIDFYTKKWGKQS